MRHNALRLPTMMVLHPPRILWSAAACLPRQLLAGGAPSGAHELGVELAKWYYPAVVLAKEDHPAA